MSDDLWHTRAIADFVYFSQNSIFHQSPLPLFLRTLPGQPEFDEKV